MKTVLSLLLLFFIHANTFSQAKMITRAQANADIDSLISWISGTHPDMYAVCPQKTFDEAISAAQASLPEKMSVRDFFVRAAPCVAMLGDGHTSLSYSISNSGNSFPFLVNVNSADSTLTMRKTDQILSINGISYRTIVENMIRCSSGERTPFRLRLLEWIFPYVLPGLYPAESYLVEYKRGGKTYLDTIKTVAVTMVEKKTDQNPVPYAYTLDPKKSAAIFTFNQFSDIETFRKFLVSMFTEIKEKKVSNLVIDLRNNGGGNSGVGDQLLRYISPVPFRQYDQYTERVSKYSKKVYPKDPRKDGLYIHKLQKEKPFRDNDLFFKGKIYLLQSAYTFSSASDFAWTFKHLKLGTIIGEESGGVVVTFGDALPLGRLPNSGLSLRVSYKKFYGTGAKKETHRGVIPDRNLPASQALDFTLNQLLSGN